MSAELVIIAAFGAAAAAIFYVIYEFGFKNKGLKHSL